jgi:hypothetical protein
MPDEPPVAIIVVKADDSKKEMSSPDSQLTRCPKMHRGLIDLTELL